jgi:translocation and assembly module TamB
VNLGASQDPFQISKLNADLNARNIQLNGDNFGDITLTSQTRGKSIGLAMRSNFAQSSIQADGTVQLAGGYPTRGSLAFSNIRYSNFAPFFTDLSGRPGFDALVNGHVTVDGPVTDLEALRASLSLEQLQLSTSSARDTKGDSGPVVLIANSQPMVFELNRGTINIRSARLTGHSTDISASGTVGLKEKRPLNVQLKAVSELAVLQQFSKDIYSRGSIDLDTMIRGSMAQPLANGKIELKNASINLTNSPNGLSNANGVILLNGTTATFRNLTGESGGGKITLSGFAGLTGTTLRYAMRATATRVRTRYQGASIVSTANLTLNGTTERSLLSGLVTIDRIAFNKQADVGSILSSTAAPPQAPSAPSGPLAGMRLDIRVQTSPALSVQTSIAQNLSATADLTVTGTVLDPNVLGRVVVTQGTLVFFGNQYTVTRGLVNFYNPIKIEPVLDVDLQTTVKGVDVILGVDGPVDNMKLSYRSDPPLRFDEIVALLATGKTPTSDPTIAAHSPTSPDQSLTQRGESALVSSAIAAPVASRLQRVFGVNQIKIDPTFTSGSTMPQTRVTLQQQISPTIVFTYTTDLSQTTAQIIRVEWSFTPKFSAVATRDDNGVVSLDFFWKKQYR